MEALAAHRRGGALLASAESTQRTFLALSAQAVGLVLVEASFSLGPENAGAVPVFAEVLFRGDPFGLPALLALVGRQRATARLESVVVEGPMGPSADVTVRWCLHRPPEVDASWVAERVAVEAPVAVASAPTLSMAVALSRWRPFTAGARGRSLSAQAAAREAARELPARIVRWNQSGERIDWTSSITLAPDRLLEGAASPLGAAARPEEG